MRLVFAKENKDIFEMLHSGSKKVETRAATPKYQKIKVGQTITFSCNGKTFEKDVAKASHFKDIKALLKVYTPEHINPNLHTEREIVAMYHSFPGYEEKIREHGIIAIELN